MESPPPESNVSFAGGNDEGINVENMKVQLCDEKDIDIMRGGNIGSGIEEGNLETMATQRPIMSAEKENKFELNKLQPPENDGEEIKQQKILRGKGIKNWKVGCCCWRKKHRRMTNYQLSPRSMARWHKILRKIALIHAFLQILRGNKEPGRYIYIYIYISL